MRTQNSKATATTFLLLTIALTMLISPSNVAGEVIIEQGLEQFPSCGRVIENYVMGNTPVDSCWGCHNILSPTPPMETLGSPPPVSSVPPVSEPGRYKSSLLVQQVSSPRPVRHLHRLGCTDPLHLHPIDLAVQ